MDTLSEIIAAQGGVTKFASDLGLPLGTVSAWKTRNCVPAGKVIDVERLTGVSRHKLRPDVFGETPSRARATRAPAHTREG